MQLSCYNQVLTGILPYHRGDGNDMVTRIRAGGRPSRPIDASKSRLLENRVWNVITTGWRVDPYQRCELSVIYHTFSPPGQREVQNLEPGDLTAQNDGNFRPPQNPESETQRQVNEMNGVGFFLVPPFKADKTRSTLRTTPCRIGSD